jgi:hypothetical protein
MVLALYEQRAGDLGLLQLLDLLEAHGVPRATIEAALANDPDGRGALRDRMRADMTNGVFADLGIDSRQTAADVRRLRDGGSGGPSTTCPAGGARPPKDRR